MGPIYDPSVYQPPSPTERLSPDEFSRIVSEIERKPDVDAVYEILSMLRAQESIGPSRIPLRRFLLHPFMIFPVVILLLMVGMGIYAQVTRNPSARVDYGSSYGYATAPDPTGKGGLVFVVLLALFIALVAIRASIRDKHPDIREMRSRAATSITRIALHPKYIHEPFMPSDCDYLQKLLSGHTRDANEALAVLMSDETTAFEPDPEFVGGEKDRSELE